IGILSQTEVPDVRGHSIREAKQMLKDKALGANVQSQDGNVDDLRVSDQSEPPGKKVRVGTSVRLIVQQPQPPTKARLALVLVPDLRGLSRQEAMLSVRANNLRLGQETTQPSNRPEGTVIEQQPAPNASVVIETVVNVILAAPLVPPTPTPPPPP